MADSKLSAQEIYINLALGNGGCHFQHVLGEGSFGKVVRAMHKVTKRHYAIKMMICNVEEQIKYQERELALLTKLELSNSNVIRYFNSWVYAVENKQILCIQMELCGWNLYQLLQSYPLCVTDERRFYKHIFPQILNGLDAIHDIGWVHRDIHPGNILIANPKPNCIFRDTVIKIADFGLARHIDTYSMKLSDKPTLDKLSPNVGNHFFRAPEMSGDIYDNKVDLYSAGIVLYMLSCYLEALLKVTDVKQWEAMWKVEILALRERKRDETNLCHQDQLLIKLLVDLLEQDPAKRPSARDALKRFSVTEEADGTGVNSTASSPTPRAKFLVKKENDESYNRCSCPVEDQSLAGLKEAIQTCSSVGITKENQLIRQEICDPNGKIVDLVNVTSDADVKEMFRSAGEVLGRRVKLIVSNKDKPGAEIPEQCSSTEAMEPL